MWCESCETTDSNGIFAFHPRNRDDELSLSSDPYFQFILNVYHGAWYAAFFNMLYAFLFLGATSEGARCGQPRCLVVSSLVVGILALILTFIGMIADFVWMGFGNAIHVCDERLVVGTEYAAELTANSLLSKYNKCEDTCFAAHFNGEDSLGLCYHKLGRLHGLL